jgi:hypothetical protein
MSKSYESFFNDDPWAEITAPCYPDGRQLYKNDDRFWVSRSQQGKIQFFVHEKEMIDIKSLENLAGIEIKINTFNERSSRLICTLISAETEVKDKFSIVAKDVSFYCSKYSGPQLFLKVQERIKSWANFLKPTQVGLSQPELIGFWGELYAISKLFMNWRSPTDVVRFWVGPEGKKQDITLNAIAVEVKTSISGDPRTIKISSVEQLERITKFLYLLHIIASPSDNESGITLEMLYQECLGLLSHDMNAETLFLQKTSELYGKASEAQLGEKYSIAKLSLFEVNDDFPFITRNEIREGIATVQYEILTSSLKKFDVTESLEEIIKNG